MRSWNGDKSKPHSGACTCRIHRVPFIPQRSAIIKMSVSNVCDVEDDVIKAGGDQLVMRSEGTSCMVNEFAAN